MRELYEKHLTLLRSTVQERHGFSVRQHSSPFINGFHAEESPLAPLWLPTRPLPEAISWRRDEKEPSTTAKPTAVRAALRPEDWSKNEYAILHDMTHLALWHSRYGVYAANEAEAIVLEAAWADDILGKGWGHVLTVELGLETTIPYMWSYPAVPEKHGYSEVSQWHRPRRAAWWRVETAKLIKLGCLTPEGKPTYKRADWRGVTLT